MSYITPLETANATGTVAQQFTAINKMLGIVPNMMRSMAQSPAVLSGYLALSGELAKEPLPASLREKIALATAQTNRCNYCLAAHTALAKGLKVTEDDSIAARNGKGATTKETAILSFAQAVADKRGSVTGEDWATLRAAGVTDAEAGAVIAEVALNVLTNYFNNATETPLDFPAAPAIR